MLTGRFIQRENDFYVQDRMGTVYPLANAKYRRDTFTDTEGKQWFPRPFVLDSQGKVQKQGDIVLLAFDGDDYGHPIVMGCIEPVNKHSFFTAFAQDTVHIQKERLVTDECIIEKTDDGKGEQEIKITCQGDGTGNITLELVGTSGNGNVTLKTSGDLNITAEAKVVTLSSDYQLQAKSADITVEEKIIVDSPGIELGRGATEPVVLGEKIQQWFNTTFLVKLLTMIDAITHLGNLGAPTSPPTVPLLPRKRSLEMGDDVLSEVTKSK